MTSTDDQWPAEAVAYEREIAGRWARRLREALISQGYDHWDDGITRTEASEYYGISPGAAAFQLHRCAYTGVMDLDTTIINGHRFTIYRFTDLDLDQYADDDDLTASEGE